MYRMSGGLHVTCWLCYLFIGYYIRAQSVVSDATIWSTTGNWIYCTNILFHIVTILSFPRFMQGNFFVTITGTSFGLTGQAMFGNVVCQPVSRIDTQIICYLPPGQATIMVSVIVAGQVYNGGVLCQRRYYKRSYWLGILCCVSKRFMFPTTYVLYLPCLLYCSD